MMRPQNGFFENFLVICEIYNRETKNTCCRRQKIVNIRQKTFKTFKSEEIKMAKPLEIDLVSISDGDSIIEVDPEATETIETTETIEIIDLTSNSGSVRPTPNPSPVRIMDNGIALDNLNPRSEDGGCPSPMRIFGNGMILEQMHPPNSDQLDLDHPGPRMAPRPMGPMGRAISRLRERDQTPNLDLVQLSSGPRLVPVPLGRRFVSPPRPESLPRPDFPSMRRQMVSTPLRPTFPTRRQTRQPLRSAMAQRLRQVPSPDRRYMRESQFNPVVPLQRLEDIYPHMLVDQRINARADASEEIEVSGLTRDNYLPGGPIIGGHEHYTIDYMRLLQGAERARYLNEWVHEELHRDIHRGLEDREEFEHEFRAMAEAEADMSDRAQAEAETKAEAEAVAEARAEAEQVPGPDDWTCIRCGSIFSSVRILGLHTCTPRRASYEAEAETQAGENNMEETEAEDNLDVGGVGDGTQSVGVANLITSSLEGANWHRIQNSQPYQNSIEDLQTQQRIPAPAEIYSIHGMQWYEFHRPTPRAPETETPDLE